MRVLIPQQILSSAWHLVWRQWRSWFDLALIPLIWLLALDLLLLPDPSQITGLTAETAQAKGGEVISFFGSVVLYMVLSLAIWTTFATAWLRACFGRAARRLAGRIVVVARSKAACWAPPSACC